MPWARFGWLLALAALSACSGGSGSSTPAGPGITLTLSGGGTSVTEGAASDTYTLVLASAPSADVIITMNHDGQLTTLPPTLTFTAANWNQAQIVTVAAIDDTESEGNHSSVIGHNVTSADARYHQFAVGSVTVNITDNDTAGVTVTESTGSTQVTEGGATDSYTVVLASQPAGDTTITLSFGGQITASPTTLTFTPANWNTQQIVTVTAASDGAIEGAHSATITHGISSADPKYSALTVSAVTVEIIDDDTITTLNFIGSDAVVHEGDGVISIPVRMTLNGPVSLAAPITATVNARFSSTATNISDYTLLTGGVTFPTGSTDNTTQMVSIGIQNDGGIEALESIELRLTDPNGIGATLGAHADYHIHLRDNDRPNLIASAVTNSAGYDRSLLLGINPANAVTQRLSGAGLAGFPAVSALAFDINANTLYAVSQGELLKINFYTGTGSVVGPTPISKGMAFSSNNGLIYGSDGTTLYSYNTSTNVTTEIGDFGSGYTDVQGLAFDIQGVLLFGSDVATNSLLSIDISSGCASNNTCGVATPVGIFSGVAALPVLAFDANNFILYGVSTSTGRLYTIDTASGATTLVGPLGYGDVAALTYDMVSNTLYGFDGDTRQLIVIDEDSGAGEDYKVTGLGDNTGGQLRGMAYDAIRQLFYGVSSNPLGGQYLVKVHPNTGTATSIAALSGVTGTLYDLAYDPNAEILYGVAGTRLYRIDTATAAATQIGTPAGNLRGLAFDPDNNRLYASDLADDQLYRLDTSDGTKTLVGGLGFGDVEGLAYNASGDILYGINTDPAGETPRLITINTGNGAGSAVGPANGVLHEDVTGALAYDQTNGRLYGANQLGLLQLNTGSGVGTTKGQLGLGAISGLAYNPNSGVYYAIVNDADDGKLVTVDFATGTTTPIGNLGIACCVEGLAFNANSNTLYAVNTATRQLLTINTGTGAAGSVGAIGFDDVPGALAFDGNTLYGIGGTGAGPYTYELITINTGAGAGSAVAAVSYDGITALAFDPDGAVLYGFNDTTSQLVTIDTGSGAGNVIGTTGYSGIRGLTWRD